MGLSLGGSIVLPLKKIVCPTDFSEPADEGLKIARELATQFCCFVQP